MLDKPLLTYAYIHRTSSMVNVVANALIQLGDGWHTAPEIQRSLGQKRKLTNTARAALMYFVEIGFVEMRRTETGRPGTMRYEYKVIGDLSSVDKSTAS